MYSRKSAPKGIENKVLRMIQDEVESVADDSSSSYEFDERINELLMSWDDEIEELSEREYRMLMRFIEDIADAVEGVNSFDDEDEKR
jgi:archaellum component FlaC